jgi:hypothetical protein
LKPTSPCGSIASALHGQSWVDQSSMVVAGCSGGGDLESPVATQRAVCAIVAEEPASNLMTGVFNNHAPRNGERFTSRTAPTATRTQPGRLDGEWIAFATRVERSRTKCSLPKATVGYPLLLRWRCD